MRSPLLRALCLSVAASLACGGSDDSDDDGSSSTTNEPTASAGSSSTGDTAADSETSAEESTGDPVGHEYGPCPNGIGDCPEGVLYACFTQITAGAVCAPECDVHEDCPPPPPGGNVSPVCTGVDGHMRCLLALCETDEDCPTGMTCYEDVFNWCHWPT
jgi:hypothetical protein